MSFETVVWSVFASSILVPLVTWMVVPPPRGTWRDLTVAQAFAFGLQLGWNPVTLLLFWDRLK